MKLPFLFWVTHPLAVFKQKPFCVTFLILLLFSQEFNDEAKYARNLGRLKKILLKTGAGIAFSLTTPVPYDERKNKLVVQYNDIAKK